MKKLLLLFVIIFGSILLYFYAKPAPIKKVENITQITPTPEIIPQKKEVKYIFVPYWSFTKNIVEDSEASLIYFGLGVNDKGLEKEDQGYKKMKGFLTLTPNARERILTIRMTDKTINAKVIKDVSLQQKIIAEAIEIALDSKFDGILLDYETSAFAFDSTTNNISVFQKLFAEKVKEKNLIFYTAIYGDTYFQSRPFDVKKIGNASDKVIVMAYDFSKSRGNPGPNFPLFDNRIYGYSFEKMVGDFQKDVDNQKLIVAMGYFGYDWRVNEIGESVTTGVPLSTNEINNEFVEKCKYKKCVLTRDEKSLEPSVSYEDEGGEGHIIWFEDKVSVDKKIEFLKSKGILETASWAYSYY